MTTEPKRRSKPGIAIGAMPTDLEGLTATWMDLAGRVVQDPAAFMSSSASLLTEYTKILTQSSDIQPDPTDSRFQDPRWQDHPLHRMALQSWIALSRESAGWLKSQPAEGLEYERRKFLIDLIVAALNPKNSALTNPEVIDRTLVDKGANLGRGATNMLRDLVENGGLPRQANPDDFELGVTMAATPGDVVYRSEMFEIIEYGARSKTVHETPLLVVCSMINRYYVVDQTEEGSLVRFFADQGFRTFALIWRNPGRKDGHWNLDSYASAVLEACDAVKAVTGAEKVNMMAICAGGFAAMAALVHGEAEGRNPVNALSFLVSAFDNPTDGTILGLVGDGDLLEAAKARTQMDGIFDQRQLSWAFNLMQPDRLIWDYAIDNYLLGDDPAPNAMMFWMADQVNIAAGLHVDLLDILGDNKFVEAGAVDILGTPLDLSIIPNDTLLVSAEKDHIMPWSAGLRSMAPLTCNKEFLLTVGGHVTPMLAGAEHPRSGYWINPDSDETEDGDAWLAGAEKIDRSWRHYYAEWLATRSGKRKSAPKTTGSETYPALDPAPGRYVFDDKSGALSERPS